MIKDFTSIHTHSHFSVMDGLSLPQEIIQTAKDRGLKSIAITDHGHAHAHADFYLHGKKLGMKTIMGVEAYVIDSLTEWKAMKEAHDEGQDEDATNTGIAKALRRKGHLVLLASNRKGLSNLYQLIYRSHKEGFYGKPRMDKEMLRTHSEGLVASSACMGGVISNKIWQYDRKECDWASVKETALDFDSIFGRGRFFLELQFNESKSQDMINKALVQLHEETGIPLIVTLDSHYTNPEDWEAQEFLYLLRGNKTHATKGADWNFEIKQLYIKSPEEVWESYKKYGHSVPEKYALQAAENTILVDSLIEDFEPDVHQRLPTLKNIDNPFKRMGELAIAEMKRRGLHTDERYTKQLLHELKVIKDKGIANYFLIMRQMINEAKKEMLVGPGRGSAAGSLVCYMLGITDLDPIKHDLMFERFLDPSRVELPDIDTDFEDPDRVKEILRGIFGEDNVASLSSYGTFQIKGLLKDLARVYDLDHNEVNKVNKLIEKDLRVLYINQDKSTIVIKLEDIERVSPNFNKFVKEHPDVGKHLKHLYGRNRHVSRHAAGIIIGDNLPAETAVFAVKDKDTGEMTAQTSFTEGIVNKNISAMGFVKFDLLGLANLRVIHHALDLISQKTGKTFEELSESIRPHNMNMDDPKVLQHVFWKGNFAGIFQFTEKGIRKVAKNIKPDSFEDITAIAALYRPGPLGAGVDKLYGENKQKFKDGQLTFEHPLLEKILKRTYGCLIYQEQLMQIARELGKMEFKDVQRIRKVLLKKDKSKSEEFLKKENDELKGKFIAGCLESGLTKERAEQWWHDMLYFGGYGFNVAHAAAYSVVTMQTAYLATYHPLEFYSALLTKGQSGNMQDYISDIKMAGIKILPVDVNRSKHSHAVEDGAIRLSFRTVMGVGPSAIDKIVTGQEYTSFFEFVKKSGASKTAISPLILAGAFDSLHTNMRLVETWYEKFLDNPKHKTKLYQQWIDSCLAEVEKIEDYKLHEKVMLENQLLGFSVRGSPFEILDRKQKIEQIFADNITSYADFMESDEEVAMLPVVVKDLKERPQRNKLMMCFLKLGAESGEEFEVPAFGNIWKHIAGKIRKGSVYIATVNRKLEDPESLVLGRPGFAHSAHSASTYMIDVDEAEL